MAAFPVAIVAQAGVQLFLGVLDYVQARKMADASAGEDGLLTPDEVQTVIDTVVEASEARAKRSAQRLRDAIEEAREG